MLLSLILALFTSQVSAFTLNYSPAGGYSFGAWQTKSLNFDFNYANCSIPSAQVEAAIQDALSVWNGIPSSSLSVKLGSAVATTPTQAKTPGSSGNPIVVCDPNFSANTGADGNFVPAAASITYADAEHHITNAVLFLNSESGKTANISNISVTTLSVIMAHEMGHALGLGHSSDDNALMYYNASAKTQLSLAKDDVEGMTYLYPRNEFGGSAPLGCNSVKSIRSPFVPTEDKTKSLESILECTLLLFILYRLSKRIPTFPSTSTLSIIQKYL